MQLQSLKETLQKRRSRRRPFLHPLHVLYAFHAILDGSAGCADGPDGCDYGGVADEDVDDRAGRAMAWIWRGLPLRQAEEMAYSFARLRTP